MAARCPCTTTTANGGWPAVTGVFVVPAVPYLQALGLALNLEYPVTAAAGSALLVVPGLIGMQAGQWLRQRLSPTRFKLCFMVACSKEKQHPAQ